MTADDPVPPTRARLKGRQLAVAILGVLASFGLVTLGWFGIRLLMTAGPPVDHARREVWLSYAALLGGIIVCGCLMLWSFRLLDRWGLRPPPE